MIRSAARFLPAVASVMLVASAARAQTPPAPNTAGWEESGEATWYGGRHHGRRTSSGTIFDQNAMTAAHSSLPLGSRIRVTMQDTGASVVVTVTDRQPHKYIRVIDLSRGAASRIGLLSRGTAMVTLATARADDVVEVAEAPDASSPDASSPDAVPSVSGVSPRRHGQRRTPLASRTASAHRPCCRAPSVVPVRNSAQRPATPRKL